MKIQFNALETLTGKVSVSLDNGETYTEYNVADVKDTGIELDDSQDISKIIIKGDVATLSNLSISKSVDIEGLKKDVDNLSSSVEQSNEQIQEIQINLNELQDVVDSQKVIVDSELNTESTNPVQNQAIAKLIPNQANEANKLADKDFVNSTLQTATSNFRGNYNTWDEVPSIVNVYPENYKGDKTPLVNDYLVVQDATSFGSDYEGTWRFKYSGDWGTLGKDGWRPEYRVNETPMTAEQLASVNSGITKDLVNKFNNIINDSTASNTTTYSSGKIDEKISSCATEADLTSLSSSISSHTSNKSNPHSVTKAQIGLGNVNNTADVDKTVKNAYTAYSGEAYICYTAAETQIKDITIPGIREFQEGMQIRVVFKHGNSAVQPQLRINGDFTAFICTAKGEATLDTLFTEFGCIPSGAYGWGAFVTLDLILINENGLKFLIAGNPCVRLGYRLNTHGKTNFKVYYRVYADGYKEVWGNLPSSANKNPIDVYYGVEFVDVDTFTLLVNSKDVTEGEVICDVTATYFEYMYHTGRSFYACGY